MSYWKFKTKNFVVEYKTRPERFDGSYMEPDLVLECKTKIGSGEWECFVAEIVITHRATKVEVANEYLGQCIYTHPKEFIDHRGMKGKGYGSYFSQRVREACTSARKTMKDERERALAEHVMLMKGLVK